MGNLVFQATLGGQVNLVGPNTASTYNLNVPAVAGTLVTTGDTATVTNTMISGPVSIANGGTNNSSFTAKSGNVAGLVFYDGTKLANDATVTDIGYDTSANKLTTGNDASISGLTVGKGAGAVSTNTAVGASALAANTSGDSNVAVGFYALVANTTGTYNVSIGRNSLLSNTTGNSNSAFGHTALNGNTTGGSNVAVGHQSLYSNTTASNNTAVGYQAAYSNTTGTNITAVGEGAAKNSTANHNTAIGTESLLNTTSGESNTGLGHASLYSNTTGTYNTAIGRASLQNNTTASGNTAVGYQAGYTNSTGTQGVFLGYQAGYTTTGNYNTYLGYQAGVNATTGTLNTFVGNGAGTQVTSGGKNIILGSYNGNQGGLDIRTASNYIVLSDGDGNPRVNVNGSGAIAFKKVAFDYTTLGGFFDGATFNSAGTGDFLNCYSTTSSAYRFYVSQAGTVYATSTTISSISDIRFKENVRDLNVGLAEVMALKPRLYDWKEGKGANIKNARGFIAQEFEKVFPDLIDEWKDEAPEGEEPYKSVRQDLIPVLVKAIQELNTKVEAQAAEIATLKGQA